MSFFNQTQLSQATTILVVYIGLDAGRQLRGPLTFYFG
jgi:hypothetical protein